MNFRIRTTVAQNRRPVLLRPRELYLLVGFLQGGAIGFRHDIFSFIIPTSGTHEARRTMVFAAQAFLSQPVFFSEGSKPVYLRFF
jgi:hypothetical protein